MGTKEHLFFKHRGHGEHGGFFYRGFHGFTRMQSSIQSLPRIAQMNTMAVGLISVWLSGARPSPILQMREPADLLHRFADDQDLDLLAEWNHQLIRDEGHRNPMTGSELKKRMEGWLTGEYKAVLFSLANKVVAYALYRETADELYLRQLFVSRDRRREGIGRAAMKILMVQVWPKKRLTVEILCKNTAAIEFYRSLGFQDYGLAMEIMPGSKT
jgi:ribosomal protein S18 acetylase RimI-like enzyme